MSDALISMRDVEHDYRSLRPLRVRRLDLRAGESVALLGLDQAAAEVLVNLVTGATLPDRGVVEIFGAETAAIADAATWMRTLDRFGILSERVALVPELTVEQNLVLPVSLEVDDIAPAVRSQIMHVAGEVGLDSAVLPQPPASLTPAMRLRLRLAKALVLNPQVLLAEHPNASVSTEDLPVLAADLAGIIASRRLAALVVTADRTFARAVSERVLTLQPATGELKAASGWRNWFSG